MVARKLLLGFAVALTALTLVACGTSSGPRGSGIFGIVVISGGYVITSPSPLPDGFGSSPYPPCPSSIAVTATKGGEVVARTRTVHSLFRMALPPGRYALQYDEPGYPPVTVTVRGGEYTRAILTLTGH